MSSAGATWAAVPARDSRLEAEESQGGWGVGRVAGGVGGVEHVGTRELR